MLYLLEDVSFEQLAKEFRDTPDTFLLFMSQLQILTIEIHPPNAATIVEQYRRREMQADDLHATVLEKSTTKDEVLGAEEKYHSIKYGLTEKKYYVVKSDLRNLPEDAARKDKRGKNIDYATVVLAFPVNENDEPIIEPQHAFAFLFLRRVGFNFLVSYSPTS